MATGRDVAAHLGRARSVARGGTPPGVVPFGYCRVAGRYEVEAADAAVVRRVFREFWLGKSYDRIAAGLNADDVAAPRGGPWKRATLRNMIRNESYAGVARYGSARRRSLPPIIPAVVFYRTQRVVAARGCPPAGVGRRAATLAAKRGLNPRRRA